MMTVMDLKSALNVAASGSHGEQARVSADLLARVSGVGAAAATAGAASVTALTGKVTTEALTTAQNAVYTLTITNPRIAAGDVVLVSLANGTNTQGTPVPVRVTPGAGSVAVVVKNIHHAAEALNGTLVVSFHVIKAA